MRHSLFCFVLLVSGRIVPAQDSARALFIGVTASHVPDYYQLYGEPASDRGVGFAVEYGHTVHRWGQLGATADIDRATSSAYCRRGPHGESIPSYLLSGTLGAAWRSPSYGPLQTVAGLVAGRVRRVAREGEAPDNGGEASQSHALGALRLGASAIHKSLRVTAQYERSVVFDVYQGELLAPDGNGNRGRYGNEHRHGFRISAALATWRAR